MTDEKMKAIYNLRLKLSQKQQSLIDGTWIDKTFAINKAAAKEWLSVALKLKYQQLVHEIEEIKAELEINKNEYLDEWKKQEGWKTKPNTEIKISQRKTKIYDTKSFISKVSITDVVDALSISKSKLSSDMKKLYEEFHTETKITTSASWKE